MTVSYPEFFVSNYGRSRYYSLIGTVTNTAGADVGFWAEPKSICYMHERYTLIVLKEGACTIRADVKPIAGYSNVGLVNTQVVSVRRAQLALLSPVRIATSISSSIAGISTAVIATILPGTYCSGGGGWDSCGTTNLATSWIQCYPGFVPDQDVAPSSACESLYRGLWAPKSSYAPGTYGYVNYTSGVEGLREGYIPVAMGKAVAIGTDKYVYSYVVWDYPKG
jgi:hypothetical protein